MKVEHFYTSFVPAFLIGFPCHSKMKTQQFDYLFFKGKKLCDLKKYGLVLKIFLIYLFNVMMDY